ncbi:MAG: anthranilate synthase component I [Terriglobales bacterium]
MATAAQESLHAGLPSLDEVRRLAARYNVIPLTRTLLADLETPVAVYLKLTDGGKAAFAYLLESVAGPETVGRFSYIGLAPYRILRQRGGAVAERRPPASDWRPCPGALMEIARAEVHARQVAPMPGLPFLAGAVGYFGYDMVRQTERLPERAQDDLGLDEALLMFFSRQIVFDHARRQMTLVACIMAGGARPLAQEYARARRDLAAIERRLKQVPRPPAARRYLLRHPKIQPTITRPKFLAMVARAKEYIAAGDVFQVVLSMRWDVRTRVPPFQAYRALRTVNPSPYMFFLRLESTCIVGASPEMLVAVNGEQVLYRPIAGTRPRGPDEAADAALERELLADEKERAEHVMLVDLGRNDVGRVAATGSVTVPRLMFVEKYSHVQHLVSEIRARLRPSCDLFDALTACFPAGTLSGAPKVRAMEIIEELEPTRRGVYGGSVLYLDFSGNLNACIAIRTMVMRPGVAHIQAGAGIVADSVPEREYDECASKAGALLRALEIASHGL